MQHFSFQQIVFSEVDYLYTEKMKAEITLGTPGQTLIHDSAPTRRISKLQIHHTVTRPMHC